MSTDEAGVLADLDARATALIGAPYLAIRTAMLNGMFSVIAYAVSRWSPSSSGAASALATTGADVDVSGASPPSAGQVLTATDATHATWQTPSAGSSDHATLTHLDYASSGHTGFVPSTRTLTAGTGLTGGGALSADRTLSLDVSGVTAASKGSATRAVTLTVDAYGRATALSDVLITPAWSSLTGTPTTLAGYGITNAVSTGAGFAVHLSASLSLGTDYEIAPTGHIIRRVAAGFDADPATNWSRSTTGSTSHTVSGGELTIVHDGSTSDNWFGGTGTAPRMTRTLGTGLFGARLVAVWKLRMTAANATNDIARVVLSKADGYSSLGFDIQYNGSAYALRTCIDDGQGAVVSGVNLTTATTGWWVRIETDSWGRYLLSYATASGSEPSDTGWTYAALGTTNHLSSALSANWVWAACVIRVSGTGGTGAFTPGSERVTYASPSLACYVPLGGQGYIASTAITTHLDVYVGAVSDANINAAVQAALALALNRLPGDTATWQVAVTRSATTGGYGAASWTGTGAVALTGSGAYLRIQIRATGTTTQGSILPSLLSFSVV